MPRRRAIDWRDLDEATRNRIAIEPGSRETATRPRAKGPARDEHAIGRKRHRTGSAFEAELNLTHRQYELQRWGKIWPHSPPFVHVRGQWLPRAGGGPVDRTGHVRVACHGPRCFGCPDGTVVPVAFDAKVCDGHTYRHSAKQRHQLVQLRAAHEAGVAAFLLVHAVPVDRVFLVEIDVFETDLLTGKGVRLYDSDKRDPKVITPWVPSVTRGATHAIAGWDWIPLLAGLTTPPSGR